MEVQSLDGADGRAACYLVKVGEVSILLDAAPDTRSILRSLPLQNLTGKEYSSKCFTRTLGFGDSFLDANLSFSGPLLDLVDLASVDAVLISNFHNMLALPHIVESARFTGRVYASEPTIEYARQAFSSLAAASRESGKKFLPEGFGASFTRKEFAMPSAESVQASLSRVLPVSHGQVVHLLDSVDVTPVSSGFCIGGCNWIISSPHSRLCYISSSSTAVNRHPKPLDLESLKRCDIAIVSDLAFQPESNPDRMAADLCAQAALTVQRGGNVLIPVHPSGVVYDLIPAVLAHLSAVNIHEVPIYFISPTAKSSLAFANIFCNWLCDSKADRVYLPEWPFTHDGLVELRLLQHFQSVQDPAFKDTYREPCIVFADHPSLRAGSAVHFMNVWGQDPSNCVVLIEPEFCTPETIQPFHPLHMQMKMCPIDPRLKIKEANALLGKIQPRVVLASPCFLAAGRTAGSGATVKDEIKPEAADSQHLSYEGTLLPINVGTPVVVPEAEFLPGHIDTELAESITLRPAALGTKAAFVKAQLVVRDYKYRLEPLRTDKHLQSSLGSRPTIETLIRALKTSGFSQLEIEEVGERDHIVHVRDADTSVRMREDATEVFARDPKMYSVIRKVVLGAFA